MINSSIPNPPADSTTEEWRDIPHFDGYEVSNHGHIRSGWYPTKNGRLYDKSRKKTLKPVTRKSDQYQRLTLIDSDGTRRDVYVHLIVMRVFVGDCPQGLECRHVDGNPTNNHLSNLEYGTRLENSQDRIRHGTSTRGADNNTTKLSLDQVAAIKRRIDAGDSDSNIAKDYPVSRGEIYNIRTGTAWGWIDEQAE